MLVHHGTPTENTEIDLLEQVQRRAARFVTNDLLERGEACVSQALNYLYWPTLQHKEANSSKQDYACSTKHLTTKQKLLFRPMSSTSNSNVPATPIHLSLLHSKHMRTSSAFGRKRLSDVHDITSVFSVETSIHGLKCWVITRASPWIYYSRIMTVFHEFSRFTLCHTGQFTDPANPPPDPVSPDRRKLGF